MKKTLLIVSGALASIVVLATLAYFFFLRGGLPGDQTDFANLGDDKITLTGTIHVPPPLANSITNGKGVTTFTLGFAPNLLPTQLLRHSAGLTFPYKFSFSVPRALIASTLPPSETDFFLSATYFPNLASTEDIPPSITDTEPLVLARGMISLAAPNSGTNNNTYDFGNIFFSRHYPRGGASACLAGPAWIAGKVTPSADFLKKNGNAKFALIAIQEQFPIFNLPYQATIPTEQQLDQALPPSQYKMIDFAKGPVSFSFPKVPIITNWIRLYLVKCGEGQNSRACARNVFPIRPYMPTMAHRYRLVGKNFEAAFCGQSNYEAFADQPDGIPAISKEIPSPANPIAPQEFVPGLVL